MNILEVFVFVITTVLFYVVGIPENVSKKLPEPKPLIIQFEKKLVSDTSQETKTLSKPIPSTSRPETRPEIRPETRPKVRPEIRPEIRPETRTQTRPETRTQTRPETISKVKPISSKPEIKTETRPESKFASVKSRPESRIVTSISQSQPRTDTRIITSVSQSQPRTETRSASVSQSRPEVISQSSGSSSVFDCTKIDVGNQDGINKCNSYGMDKVFNNQFACKYDANQKKCTNMPCRIASLNGDENQAKQSCAMLDKQCKFENDICTSKINENVGNLTDYCSKFDNNSCSFGSDFRCGIVNNKCKPAQCSDATNKISCNLANTPAGCTWKNDKCVSK
jgi:hypothetical protein